MFLALNCWSPLLADAPHHDRAPQRYGRLIGSARRGPSPSAPSSLFGRDRAGALSRAEPRFVRSLSDLITLVQDGCDSQLIGYRPDPFGDDTILETMPCILSVAFRGEPLKRSGIAFEGARANRRRIVRGPNQEERLIVCGGKVVGVGV